MNRRLVSRAVAVTALVVAAVAGTTVPAAAAGSWLAPVRDRYEVGDSATLVAYVGRGTLGWVADGPFYGYLYPAGTTPGIPSHTGVPLGPLTIGETGNTGWTALRVSIEVSLAALAPGSYQVGYCNDPCVNGLGDLVGSRPINVGVDPAAPFTREWPLDEPLIRILHPDALVSGPGYRAPASEIWAGRVTPAPVPPTAVPAPAPVPGPAPSPTPLPATATAADSATVEIAPARAESPAGVAGTGPSGPVDPAAAPSGGSPLALLFGVAIAAACTAGVLRALRQDQTDAYATRGYAGSSNRSSPTTHAPVSSSLSS